MDIEGSDPRSWRNDPSLVAEVSYKRKFALFPVRINGEKVWMKFYYQKYKTWYHRYGGFIESEFGHTDLVEIISEDEYLVRKLAETL